MLENNNFFAEWLAIFGKARISTFFYFFQISNFSEQWMLDKGDLLRDRGDDLKIYTEEEYQKLMIFFTNCIIFYR